MLAKARQFLSAEKSIRVRPLVVISLLLILSLACSLPGFWGRHPAPTATATPEAQPRTPLPPALVVSEPPPNGTLMAHNGVILYFNQAINKPRWKAACNGSRRFRDVHLARLATVRFTLPNRCPRPPG